MRFLVSPNTDEFMDRNLLWGLVRSLRAAGHEAIFPARPLDGFETAPICKDLKIDVLFALNRARPYDLDKRIRHVAWFQDPPAIPHDLSKRVQEDDIVYRVLPRVAGEPDVDGRCKTGFMFIAMDETMIDAFIPPREQTVDFSFTGTMVPPFTIVADVRAAAALPKTPWKAALVKLYLAFAFSGLGETKAGRLISELLRDLSGGRLPPIVSITDIKPSDQIALINISELLNRPLAGDWNPEFIIAKMREIVGSLLPALPPHKQIILESMYRSFAQEVPRQIERFLLVENMLHITDSVELYGRHWNTHPMFAAYSKGNVTGPQALFSIYAKSRLNGANTMRSLLHRRTLECMSVGGFYFTNKSTYDHEHGGLSTFFEPGTHYGTYTAETIQEEALRWLRDDAKRIQVGRRAASLVREKHLWRHRVGTILADLKGS